jgi:hypothetical protein
VDIISGGGGSGPVKFRVCARALWVVALVALTAATAISAAPLAGASTATGQALPHTRQVVVRPVHRDGTPVRGYRVVSESHGSNYTCDYHSPVSVSSGVAWCGASADATIACWKSRHHTVLCLRDPRVHTLVRIRYSGSFSAGDRVKHPEPEALLLRNRDYCTVRIGGAWGPVVKHPAWVGYYSCSRGGAVYGPIKLSGGIDRSVNPWRVHVVRGDTAASQVIHTNRVAVAYFVGTAR